MTAKEVWVIFRQAIPMDVHMSEETARKEKFHSETVGHFIHAEEARKSPPKDDALVSVNAELREQVQALTKLLASAEDRVLQLEKVLGMPALARWSRKVAA